MKRTLLAGISITALALTFLGVVIITGFLQTHATSGPPWLGYVCFGVGLTWIVASSAYFGAVLACAHARASVVHGAPVAVDFTDTIGDIRYICERCDAPITATNPRRDFEHACTECLEDHLAEDRDDEADSALRAGMKDLAAAGRLDSKGLVLTAEEEKAAHEMFHALLADCRYAVRGMSDDEQATEPAPYTPEGYAVALRVLEDISTDLGVVGQEMLDGISVLDSRHQSMPADIVSDYAKQLHDFSAVIRDFLDRVRRGLTADAVPPEDPAAATGPIRTPQGSAPANSLDGAEPT